MRPEALVTDAGSTKCEIVDLARNRSRRCQFLGGHPMAGKEKRGAAAADADLFRGGTWVLTPDDPAELETARARGFATGWGASARTGFDASRRARPGGVAHFAPAATGLHRAGRHRGGAARPPERLAVAGPGLIDMTRLALSSYDLWRDILATNTGPHRAGTGRIHQKLEHMRENLRTRQLQEEFERGAASAAGAVLTAMPSPN